MTVVASVDSLFKEEEEEEQEQQQQQQQQKKKKKSSSSSSTTTTTTTTNNNNNKIERRKDENSYNQSSPSKIDEPAINPSILQHRDEQESYDYFLTHFLLASRRELLKMEDFRRDHFLIKRAGAGIAAAVKFRSHARFPCFVQG